MSLAAELALAHPAQARDHDDARSRREHTSRAAHTSPPRASSAPARARAPPPTSAAAAAAQVLPDVLAKLDSPVAAQRSNALRILEHASLRVTSAPAPATSATASTASDATDAAGSAATAAAAPRAFAAPRHRDAARALGGALLSRLADEARALSARPRPNLAHDLAPISPLASPQSRP